MLIQLVRDVLRGVTPNSGAPSQTSQDFMYSCSWTAEPGTLAVEVREGGQDSGLLSRQSGVLAALLHLITATKRKDNIV
jgi:hypothetical protein